MQCEALPPEIMGPPSTPMPKMGVRARVSDWPQRKDGWEAMPPPRYDNLLPALQDRLLSPAHLQDRLVGPTHPLSELLSHSPMRSLARVRRSNSEVTLNDLGPDPASAGAMLGPDHAHHIGSTLRRRYGSTSSLGGPSPSLGGPSPSRGPLGPPADLRPDQEVKQEQPSAPPSSLPPLLLSPSLLTAAQISRGDYVDPALLSFAAGPRRPQKAEASIFKRLRSVRSEPEACQGDAGPCRLTAHTGFSHYDVQSLLFTAGQPGAPAGVLSPAGSVAEPGALPCDLLVGDPDEGRSGRLLAGCPSYRWETGGETEGTEPGAAGGPNAGVSLLEVPRVRPLFPGEAVKGFSLEHLDQGAYYYHKYFYNKAHQNLLGTDQQLGPVSVSIRREPLDPDRDGPPYQYRLILRTGQTRTLRGSIPEDSVPSSSKHGCPRGLPLKDVLEYILPELSTSCLRLASSAPAIPELLLQLDQQGVCLQHQVIVALCRGSQGGRQAEDTDWSSPALHHFLDLLGQKIPQNRTQLDAQEGPTGGHCVYGAYKDHEVMFHISGTSGQQPGVTLVFQEPGAPPFSPPGPAPHGVYVVVQLQGWEELCYSVTVTRPRDMPAFGPPLPPGGTFPHSPSLGDFLLAKIINAHNAMHKVAGSTPGSAYQRHLALRQLVATWQSATPLDSPAPRFSFIALGGKKKERSRPPGHAHLHSAGGVAWPAVARGVACLLAVSQERVVLVEEERGDVLFNCFCRDVIGWSVVHGEGKIYYQRGDRLTFNLLDDGRELSQRFQLVTRGRGCEALEVVLSRNPLGQLGFQVNAEGVLADLAPRSLAWGAGLRPGGRLLEICGVPVATLSHQQMVELLRTSSTVTVVAIAPHDNGSPRRSFTEMYPGHCGTAAQPWPCGLPGFTPTSRASPPLGPSPAQPWPCGLPGAPPPLGPSPSQQMFHYAPLTPVSISRTSSFDRSEISRMHQGFAVSPRASQVQGEGLVFCNSPSNQSTSSDPGPNGTWSQCSTWRGPSPTLVAPPAGNEGRDQSKLERTSSPEGQGRRPASKVHKQRERPHAGPAASRTTGGSSLCSTNTMSSEASSCLDREEAGLTSIKGASTDSGIDSTPVATPPAPPLPGVGEEGQGLSGYQEAGTPERSRAQNVALATASGHPGDGSLSYLSDSCSRSSSRCSKSSSGRRGSPAPRLGGGMISVVEGVGPATQDKLFGWKAVEGGPCPERPDSLQLQVQPCPARDALLQVRMSDSSPGPADLDQSLLLAPPLFPVSPWRLLQRSMSEESLWSRPRSLSLISSSSSLLETPASTLPYGSTQHPLTITLPYGSTQHPLTNTLPWATLHKNGLSFSDGALAERTKMVELWSSWSHLVTAAHALPVNQVCVPSMPARGQQVSSALQDREVSAALLSGKVEQLEEVLCQLQGELRKEQEEKRLLQEEVLLLRQDNLRLHQESLSTAAQFSRYTQWLLHTTHTHQ